MTRIDQTFARLKSEGKKAFVSYIMAGDPDFETSLELVMGLPAAGVDIIELGLPFTDPMADGPTIQLAGGRSLDSGMTLIKTLEMAKKFRENNNSTPIVIMGYYNPIYNHDNGTTPPILKRILVQLCLLRIGRASPSMRRRHCS